MSTREKKKRSKMKNRRQLDWKLGKENHATSKRRINNEEKSNPADNKSIKPEIIYPKRRIMATNSHENKAGIHSTGNTRKHQSTEIKKTVKRERE